MNVECIAKQKIQNYYKRSDFGIRPVTKEDKWCRFLTKFEGELNSEAPYGYLVTIPKYFDGMELELEGRIIKNRLCDGNLLLQIIKDEKNLCNAFYGISIYSNNSGKSKYLNICNIRYY